MVEYGLLENWHDRSSGCIYEVKRTFLKDWITKVVKVDVFWLKNASLFLANDGIRGIGLTIDDHFYLK